MNRHELAAVIRRARHRLTPGEAGLPAGRNRRVAGLRREEVALLAGVSVDYVIRLEQGRGSRPSYQVLTSLARALRLTPDERDELFHLAGTPPPAPGCIDMHVRPSVLRLIDRFTDLPTIVLSAKGDVLAWNTMASALHGDWSALPPDRRNINRLRFLPDPSDPERSAVAQTPEERGAVAWRNHRKTIEHPRIGALTLDCDTLHVPDADQAVVVYSAAPGTPEHEKLALLAVIGTQDLSPAQ